MTDGPLEPTEENLIANVFGDELSSKRMAEAMRSPAGEVYNQVVSVVNGPLWARRVLPVKTTVLVNLAILATINRPHELYTRVVGLLRGGMSVEEIQEVFVHVGFYVGNPAGVEATVALHEAMQSLDERGIPYRRKIAD
jgi:4-carboxymuconolactone decarboxylase